MQIRAQADLGSLEPSWSGFRLITGMIWTPENYKLTPGDLRAIPYRAQQLRDYERQMARPSNSFSFEDFAPRSVEGAGAVIPSTFRSEKMQIQITETTAAIEALEAAIDVMTHARDNGQINMRIHRSPNFR
jgi:Phage protein